MSFVSDLDYSRVVRGEAKTARYVYAPLPWPELLDAVRRDVAGTPRVTVFDHLTEGSALARLGARIATRFAHHVPGHVEPSGAPPRGQKPACKGIIVSAPEAAIVHRVQLGYHVDTQHPYPCLNATVVFRDPEGGLDGLLVLPEQSVAIGAADGWVSIFDGSERHGVTPFAGSRIGLTYYLPIEVRT